MTLHDLMFAHRYDEVVAESERLLEERPDDPAALGWHAQAMLCLGRLPEALEESRRLEARERAYPHSAGRILEVGTVLWLLGRRGDPRPRRAPLQSSRGGRASPSCAPRSAGLRRLVRPRASYRSCDPARHQRAAWRPSRSLVR